jgi:Mg/Co/Ni transporter MgtE
MIGHNKPLTLIQEITQRIKLRRAEYLEDIKELNERKRERRMVFLKEDKVDKDKLGEVRVERKTTIAQNKIDKMVKAKAWKERVEASEEVRIKRATKFLERMAQKRAEKIAKLVA